jgi:hypothetical protein
MAENRPGGNPGVKDAGGGLSTRAHETANAGAIAESRIAMRRMARQRPSRIARIRTMSISNHRAKIE